MQNDINVNPWNPFDPEWYKEAFDRFMSNADMLFRQEEIIKQGYHIPDADGSRSSVFRNSAKLNNSFDEETLRDSLKDIYLNLSHKLVASNHDNVNFFQWHGRFNDLTLIPNTNICEMRIPLYFHDMEVDDYQINVTREDVPVSPVRMQWVNPKERDRFKMSQFYRKWIKVEDLLNNWRVFKWHMMLFIDQRIYSEYEIFVDEQEITIRFPFHNPWVRNNVPISIYRFDTNYQKRIMINRRLCTEKWNWKLPLSYIDDKTIQNHPNIIVAFNRTIDQNIRRDGQTRGIEVLGENIEFLEVKDGYIDLSGISGKNKLYIQSEYREWMWMSIIVPKFFHEYPVLLPTDVVYRPYLPSLRKVKILRQSTHQNVRTETEEDENRQVYVDIRDRMFEPNDGWLSIIRPIVFADAFDDPWEEPSDLLVDDIRSLRDEVTSASKIIERFRFFMNDKFSVDEGVEKTVRRTDDEHNPWSEGMILYFSEGAYRIIELMENTARIKSLGFEGYLDEIAHRFEIMYDGQNKFHDVRRANRDPVFEREYVDRFLVSIEDIRENGEESLWFDPIKPTDPTFWTMTSFLINRAQELVKRYYVIEVVRQIPRRHLWTDPSQYFDKVRFQRPVDCNNFWMFEYDHDNDLWKPVNLKVERHFPDAYLVSEPGSPIPTPHKVYKAFFFYSDTMNVLEEASDIRHATPSWNDDILDYHHEQAAIYRDIFMEKFYWMGVRAIYKGLMMTDRRWEAIEYVIDNPSYQRFNDLFIQTMDPYFKLGLATYLKSPNFEFPFDDAIAKMNEAVTLDWNGFKKITNFEVYLNNHWIPSYFDFMAHIMDDWAYGDRLRRRPPSTFDMRSILPILLEIQEEMIADTQHVLEELAWIISQLKIERYNLDLDRIISLQTITKELLLNMEDVMQWIDDLDLYTYSIEDLHEIVAKLTFHTEKVSELRILISETYDDARENNVHVSKKDLLSQIKVIVDLFDGLMGQLLVAMDVFDMNEFMLSTNDLNSYLDPRKVNPDDRSLLGQVNRFDDHWSQQVQSTRNKLFVSSATLFQMWHPERSYTCEEIIEFAEMVETVKNDVAIFRRDIERFWTYRKLEIDQVVVDRLDHVQDIIGDFNLNITIYHERRNELIEQIDAVKALLAKFLLYNIGETEQGYSGSISNHMDDILSALSYIAGMHRREDAVESLSSIYDVISIWFDFLEHEAVVFGRLLAIVQEPSQFIYDLDRHQLLIDALKDYMTFDDTRFIPDSGWPTYSDVYQPTEITITNHGFRYSVDDLVFVPRVGSYKVIEVEGDIAKAKMIEDMGWENTNFRNPMIQAYNRPYRSSSNGLGVALNIHVTEVTHQRIMNDQVIIPFILRSANVLHNIGRFITNPNPHNNVEFNLILNSIGFIEEDWNNLLNVFQDYITDVGKSKIVEILFNLYNIRKPSEDFMEVRSGINVSKLMRYFGDLVDKTSRVVIDAGLNNTSFYYYDEKARLVFKELSQFFGTGTIWRDTDRLKDIMDNINQCIEDCYTNGIFPIIPDGEDLDELIEIKETVSTIIVDINTSIDLLPDYVGPITSIMEEVQDKIDFIDITNLYKDIWFRINRVQPAIMGEGYQLGDVVKIVQENDDVILLQIVRVDEGKVTQLQPFMDYALLYHIWGIHETVSMTGVGYGLTVDVFSNMITLADSTLLRSDLSSIPTTPRFDDNDLFMFKFENIHDLNVQYEVFLGGRQNIDYIQRQENINKDDHLHPRNIDVIYLNANDVYNLKNSSIYIPGEHYFVYKIDHVEITDPGAGYEVGQQIFVNSDDTNLRLIVTRLVHEPYKGIEEIEMSDGRLVFRGENPGGTGATVAPDTMNNIDDEFTVTYYDQLSSEGIRKPATLSYPQSEFEFHSIRHDDMDGDDRNAVFMYPSVDMVDVEPPADRGDPDFHWYLGNRIENSLIPMDDDRWNGIVNLQPPTRPFIPDVLRQPPGQPPKGEYHMFKQLRFHRSEEPIPADLTVATYQDIPRHIEEWPAARIGSIIMVESDEMNNGHRMIYRIRSFVAMGFITYNDPEIADQMWNTLNVDWMDTDWYPDLPMLKQQYPTAPWRTSSFRHIMEGIRDGRFESRWIPQIKNHTSYIHQATINDISVFNWTLKKWEDLSDTSRWTFEMRDDPDNEDWGFKLTFHQDGYYSYDMKFYWNKTPNTQMRNAELKRDAVMDVYTSIIEEVRTPAINHAVDTGRVLRIRKLFPFEQKETFYVGYSKEGDPLGFEIDFEVANYMHYKNQLHLQDVKIFNKTTGLFEDLSDRKYFEIRFKDPKMVNRGMETQTRMTRWWLVSTGTDINGNDTFGSQFHDGEVWGYNNELGIHIFGRITTSLGICSCGREEGEPCVCIAPGSILTFIPTHCPNPPTDENITLEFQIYQNPSQTDLHRGLVQIEFQTQRVEVYDDGYIRDQVDYKNDSWFSIYHPLAPLPKEFKIIIRNDIRDFKAIYGPVEYEISIDKTPHRQTEIRPEWELLPTFTIPDKNIPGNRLYLMTDRGRFPMRNPSTGGPSFIATETETGTDVLFLNLYRRYEHLEIRSLPYPIRSVYVQRRIPSHGFIDLRGKINKPLNKKYFEFWMNGRLLHDEVTIITPTKIFLHGLRSLRNFEIIEVNRDSNEFFSDNFLQVRTAQHRPDNFWNYSTYLDAALEGNLEGDNYTLEEQEYLLSPVWRQVSPEHPSFREFPPNVDIEDDIMVRVHAPDDLPIEELSDTSYQFMMIDLPTIEGVIVAGNNRWSHFGFRELSNQEIIDLLNEEWGEEIRINPRLPYHVIISEDEWYGTTSRLYDEFGIRVHTLNESLYQVYDRNVLNINSERRSSRIIPQEVHYDLS